MTINFITPSILDINALLTMGVSVKETNCPIGQFGTGLKYAISTLTRLGDSVTISIRENGRIKNYKISVKKEIIRNKEFSIIYLGNIRTAFTTELGKNWTHLDAFRELYSNTLDENGYCTLAKDNRYEISYTKISVNGDFIEEAYARRSEMFLQFNPNVNIVYENEDIQFIEKTNLTALGKIYYRNIFVGEICNSKWNYNFLKDLDLTEDRTYKYNFQIVRNIKNALIDCLNEKILTDWFTLDSEMYEINSLSIPDSLFTNNSTAFSIARKLVNSQLLTPAFFSALVAANIDICPTNECGISAEEMTKLDAALAILTKGGYFTSAYPIKIVEHIPSKNGYETLGLAKDNQIILHRKLLQESNFVIAKVIFEEYIHNKYNVEDFTREFQNIVIHELITQISRF